MQRKALEFSSAHKKARLIKSIGLFKAMLNLFHH